MRSPSDRADVLHGSLRFSRPIDVEHGTGSSATSHVTKIPDRRRRKARCSAELRLAHRAHLIEFTPPWNSSAHEAEYPRSLDGIVRRTSLASVET